MIFLLVQTALHATSELPITAQLPNQPQAPHATHQGESWQDYDFRYDFGYPLEDEARSQPAPLLPID